MLKRQRPASPPASIPFDPNPLPLDVIAHRDAKRRRVLPPVVNGPLRGWNNPQDEESDGEIYYDDESPQVHDAAADNMKTAEYALANSVLHELHTLNQHRIMFSGPTALPPPQSPASYQYDTNRSTPTHALKHPSMPPSIPGQHHNENSLTDQDTTPPDCLLKDEMLSVKAQYEQANRLLGSLFLSRRREREPYGLQEQS